MVSHRCWWGDRRHWMRGCVQAEEVFRRVQRGAATGDDDNDDDDDDDDDDDELRRWDAENYLPAKVASQVSE